MTALKIFKEIKDELLSIKGLKKESAISLGQYDQTLYRLFVEAYKKGFVKNLSSSPLLTACGIKERLMDEDYDWETDDDSIDEEFYRKWFYWTEAVEKGIEGGFIKFEA